MNVTATPADIAHADQVGAAHRHARGMLSRVATETGSRTSEAPPGPVTARIIRRLRFRLLTERLTVCPHLVDVGPQPAAWSAYAPGRLRCPACATASAKRIKGTAEDGTCDACRKRGRAIVAVAGLLPPSQMPRYCDIAHVIVINFGLCPGCVKADQIPNK